MQRPRLIFNEARTFATAGVPRGRFRLGALESTAAVRIPSLLASFHLAFPAVELELDANWSGNLLDQLLSGKLTAAFSDGRPASPVLTGIKAFTEQLVILSSQTVNRRSEDFRGSNPTVFVFGCLCSYRQRFEDWLEAESVVPGRVV